MSIAPLSRLGKFSEALDVSFTLDRLCALAWRGHAAACRSGVPMPSVHCARRHRSLWTSQHFADVLLRDVVAAAFLACVQDDALQQLHSVVRFACGAFVE